MTKWFLHVSRRVCRNGAKLRRESSAEKVQVKRNAWLLRGRLAQVQEAGMRAKQFDVNALRLRAGWSWSCTLLGSSLVRMQSDIVAQAQDVCGVM